MAATLKIGNLRISVKKGSFKWSGMFRFERCRSKTIFERVKNGYSGSATFRFKNTGGIEKIEIRAPYLSAFGGPIRGDVHLERHDSGGVRISMKGAIESDNEEDCKKFLEQMVPEVEVDGNAAALHHAFADLDALPEHIRSAGMEYKVSAPENVEIILSKKESG